MSQAARIQTGPAHVGINALFLEPRMGGLDTYVRALVPEMARLAPHVEFSVFCNPRGREYLEAEGWGGSIELVTHPLLGRRGLRAAAELTVLGALASRRVELLHSVAMTAPLRTHAVNVVTLADLTWMVAPDATDALTMRLWRTIIPPVARRADRLLALSHAGAEHVVRFLGVPPERIDVVPLAAGINSCARGAPEAELRKRFELGAGPVILSVSAKRPHKNLARAIEAMQIVVRNHPYAKLVLAGNRTPYESHLRELAVELGVEASTVFLDYVDAADLEGLYALASCFVFPSLNEGFGLPVLEAMQRQLPVACSNVSAMPEVAGEAARYFDPYDIHDIGGAVLELLEDRALAERLVARGNERQGAFTWETTARGTLESYERAWLGFHRRARSVGRAP